MKRREKPFTHEDVLRCNPLCVEPTHLETVTPGENVRRTTARGRSVRKKGMTALEFGEWMTEVPQGATL